MPGVQTRSRAFWIWLSVASAGGLTIRLIYVFVFVVKPHYQLGGDAFFYDGQAALLSVRGSDPTEVSA